MNPRERLVDAFANLREAVDIIFDCEGAARVEEHAASDVLPELVRGDIARIRLCLDEIEKVIR